MNHEVRLAFDDPDCLRVLRRGLENLAFVYSTAGDRATASVKIFLDRGQVNESRRSEKRAAEYQRRVGLVQVLLDQVPAAPAITAPMGDES